MECCTILSTTWFGSSAIHNLHVLSLQLLLLLHGISSCTSVVLTAFRVAGTNCALSKKNWTRWLQL